MSLPDPGTPGLLLAEPNGHPSHPDSRGAHTAGSSSTVRCRRNGTGIGRKPACFRPEPTPGGCGHPRVTNHRRASSAPRTLVLRGTARLASQHEFSLLKSRYRTPFLIARAHRQTLPTGKSLYLALLPPVLVDTRFHRGRDRTWGCI